MAVEAVADREMFIDGGPVRALGGQWIDVLNPATGEILTQRTNDRRVEGEGTFAGPYPLYNPCAYLQSRNMINGEKI